MVAGDHVAVWAAMDAVASHHPPATTGVVAQAPVADSARAQPRDRAWAVHGVQMVLRAFRSNAGQRSAGVELQYWRAGFQQHETLPDCPHSGCGHCLPAGMPTRFEAGPPARMA